jgi:hypothetical protein
MERTKSFAFYDGRVVVGRIPVDKIINEHEALQESKKRVSPAEVFKGINIEEITIERIHPDPIGLFEERLNETVINRWNLFQIPDVEIDLTPDAAGCRAIMEFRICANGKTITVNALFDERSKPDYVELDDWEKPEKIEPLIREDLLAAIFEGKNWIFSNESEAWVSVDRI